MLQRVLILVCGLRLLCGTLQADTVTGEGTFQNWSAGNLDQDGKPFWDRSSYDGLHLNIGYLLRGGSSIPLPGAPGAIPFYGQPFQTSTDTGGGPTLNYNFDRVFPQLNVSLQLEISARSAVNEFGWYDSGNAAVLHTIFSGSDPAGTFESLTMSDHYGFYIRTTGGAVYRTQSSLNSAAEQCHQHFALFRESVNPQGMPVYWLGIEDLSLAELHGGEGVIGDYNDMVIRLEAVPEGSSMGMLFLGAIGGSVFLGRRVFSKK